MTSEHHEDPLPYAFTAKLFLQNILLGFVEAAVMLLPSSSLESLTSSSSSSTAAPPDNDDAFAATLRAMLRTIFLSGAIPSSPASSETAPSSSSSSSPSPMLTMSRISLLQLDKSVTEEVTFPAARLAAFPVNEARLVPSVLAPSVESLRHTLRHRLQDAGISVDQILASSSSSARGSLSVKNPSSSQHQQPQSASAAAAAPPPPFFDTTVAVARSLSTVAFYMGLEGSHNKSSSSHQEGAKENFRALTEMVDDIFLEETSEKKGKLDARKIMRVFDFFLCLTFSNAAKHHEHHDEHDLQQHQQQQPSNGAASPSSSIRRIVDSTLPWRIALQMFVETSRPLFTAQSWERLLVAELAALRKAAGTASASSSSSSSQQKLAATENIPPAASASATVGGMLNNWLTMGVSVAGLSPCAVAAIRGALLVAIFGGCAVAPSTNSSTTANSSSSSPTSKEAASNEAVDIPHRLVRFVLDQVFRSKADDVSVAAELAECCIAMLLVADPDTNTISDSSTKDSNKILQRQKNTSRVCHLTSVLRERAREQRAQTLSLLFEKSCLSSMILDSSSTSTGGDHHQSGEAGEHLFQHHQEQQQQQQQQQQQSFSTSVWRDLCLASAVPDRDALPLDASGTLPALMSDALVDEIARNPSAETVDRVCQLLTHPTLRPVALVTASRIYLSVDGCFQFFRQTQSPVVVGFTAKREHGADGEHEAAAAAAAAPAVAAMTLDTHLKLLGAVIAACNNMLIDLEFPAVDEQEQNDQQRAMSQLSDDGGNKSKKDGWVRRLKEALTHLQITGELCKAFQEINAEAETPHRFELHQQQQQQQNSNTNRQQQPHHHHHHQGAGICSSAAFERVMRPFLKTVSTTTEEEMQQPTTSSSSSSALGESWLLCYLLASRCNLINLLDNYSCELVHRATSLALAQLSMTGVSSQPLAGERVVVSCAVALQRLSRIPVLIDSSSSIISEVSQMFEILQKGRSDLPSYISMDDLVDSIVTTVVSLLLQPFFTDNIATAPDALLAKRCASFQNIWGQILSQVKRNGFKLGSGVVRATQQALGRVSLVTKIPEGSPLRRAIMISDTSELLGRAAESGTEEVLRALLSTLCTKQQQQQQQQQEEEHEDSSSSSALSPSRSIDPMIESAFTAWHLQRDIMVQPHQHLHSASPAKTSSTAAAAGAGAGALSPQSKQQQQQQQQRQTHTQRPTISAIEAAAEFLGAGDVILSVLRRATPAQQQQQVRSPAVGYHSSQGGGSAAGDAVQVLLRNLVAKSSSTSLQRAINGALEHHLPFRTIYHRLASPFIRQQDDSDHDDRIAAAIDVQYQAVEALRSFAGGKKKKDGDDDAEKKTHLQTLEDLEKFFKPMLEVDAGSAGDDEDGNKNMTKRKSLLSAYVWCGLCAPTTATGKHGDDDDDDADSNLLSSSPLRALIEHIVSCCGSIRKLGQGHLLSETRLPSSSSSSSSSPSNNRAASSTDNITIDDVIRELHSTLVRAVGAYDSEKNPPGKQQSQTESVYTFPEIWKTGSSSSLFLLRPVSIIFMVLQHLDSVIKQFVEDYFQEKNSSSGSTTSSSSPSSAAAVASDEKQEALTNALLRLASKCLELVNADHVASLPAFSSLGRNHPTQPTTSSSRTTTLKDNSSFASSNTLSQDTLCVGVLRRVGSLASPASLPLIKSLVVERFSHFAAVRSQLAFIELRLETQRRFGVCREQCLSLAMSSGNDININNMAKKLVQDVPTQKQVTVLSPVTSLVFMVMPRVAENEIVPSWMLLLENLLNTFDAKTSQAHASILTLCDALVPFADIVLWASTTFSAAARAVLTEDKGDSILLHCCFTLCLASLSKKITDPKVKQQHVDLASAFLKQLVHADILAECAMPGQSEAVARSTAAAAATMTAPAGGSNSATMLSTAAAGGGGGGGGGSSSSSSSSSSLAKLKAGSKTLDRIIKACGRAIHVAFSVDAILAMYRDVVVSQPALISLIQAAVARTKRFGTLRRALQQRVEEETSSSSSSSSSSDSSSASAALLHQQVREIDFSAISPELFATLRKLLLSARQFDTLVALFEEVVQAEPDKATLETAIEGLCVTQAQRIAFAYLHAKKQTAQQQQQQDAATNKSRNANVRGSAAAPAAVVDPGFCALQIFSGLHRSLHQSCGGKMQVPRGAFPPAASLEVRIVGIVVQGCQPSENQKLQHAAPSVVKQQEKDLGLITSLFPESIFSELETTDWFDIAFRLLSFVTESSSLRKHFVGDPKWKKSLLGIGTMRALAAHSAANTPDPAFVPANIIAQQQQQQKSNLSELFSPSVFLGEPILVIENLIMCCRTNEAEAILRQVPELNCDELIVNYAMKAVSIRSLSEGDDDLFPFGCRFSGVEAHEEDFLFPLNTELTLRLRPNQSAVEKERIREAFEFSPNPCVYLHCAIASLCRDHAFRFRRCFDYAIGLYDDISASCDRPQYQDLLVDLGSRVLAAAVNDATKAGVLQEDILLSQEANLLGALFHVARVMLLSGEEKFYTFDRFQEESTRTLAVKELVFDLLGAGLTSAASHVALSTAGLVSGLDAVWLAEATRLASLGLVDEAAAAIQRLDTTHGARTDTAQILIPLIEHAPSAGLVGCFGAVRRDVLRSGGLGPRAVVSGGSTHPSRANSNAPVPAVAASSSSFVPPQPQQQQAAATATSATGSAVVQVKYTLARTETPEIAERNKALRESVVAKMIREFCGLEGTLQFLVRQHRATETVRVALAAAAAAQQAGTPPMLSPAAFADSVFFDGSLLMRSELHEQIRKAMRRADPTLVSCRGMIFAIADKLGDVAGGSASSSAAALLRLQLEWQTFCHDHANACRTALRVAAEASEYSASLKLIDTAEEHATLSKQQPYAPERNDQFGGTRDENTNDQDDGDDDQDGDDSSASFAEDGVKYPPCKIDVMERIALLGRLRLQRTIIKLLSDSGPKVQLGWYDLVNDEHIPESVRRLASSQYRNQEILDVCLKALVSISHPIAAILTTALRTIKQASKQDMAVAFIKVLVSSPAVPASDRDSTLLECIKLLGPAVITAESSSSSSSSSSSLVKDVDAAVDAISNHDYAHRCVALLACGRMQDAYKCAAVEAQSVPLVQEVAKSCQAPPLSKLKQAKSVVDNCLQYLSFARRGGGGGNSSSSNAASPSSSSSQQQDDSSSSSYRYDGGY